MGKGPHAQDKHVSVHLHPKPRWKRLNQLEGMEPAQRPRKKVWGEEARAEQKGKEEEGDGTARKGKEWRQEIDWGWSLPATTSHLRQVAQSFCASVSIPEHTVIKNVDFMGK